MLDVRRANLQISCKLFVTYFVPDCRLLRGIENEQAVGLDPGNVGSIDPQYHLPSTATWMGDRQANPAGFERDTAGQPRRALPRAPSSGTARMDQGRMARYRRWARREILHPYPCGPRTA